MRPPRLAPIVFLACALTAVRAAEWPRIEEVLPAASRADRPVVIEFFKPDCHYCEQLHAKIWTDEAVAKLLDRAMKTRVDISSPAGAALADCCKNDTGRSITGCPWSGRNFQSKNHL